MTKRFEKAYNALVKAYFEGTLAKGHCSACAVGNIVGDAMGATITIIPEGIGLFHTRRASSDKNNHFWKSLFFTTEHNGNTAQRMIDVESGIIINDHILEPWNWQKEVYDYKALANQLKDLTDYDYKEMAKIEYAFETNSKYFIGEYPDLTEEQVLEDQYNGLSAVVDVMVKLDNIENTDNQYNKKFREHPKLLVHD